MRMRIPQHKVEVALEKAAELLPHTRAEGGTEEEEESDLTASFVVTTRYVSPPSLRVNMTVLCRAPYVSLGKQVQLLDIDGNGDSDMLGRICQCQTKISLIHHNHRQY